MKKISLVSIDFQNDFTDPKGSLYVPGADDDARRVAKLIDRVGHKFTNMYSTLDSHQINQIFFPNYWIDENNQHPAPFTEISHQQVKDGVWRTSLRGLQSWGEEYTAKLEKQGKYRLFVWPFHTILYTWGWLIYPDIAEAIKRWELAKPSRRVNFLVKGNNPYVESYSALKAEVVRSNDPSTQLNTEIVKALMEDDEIVFVGEALSHCCRATIFDVAETFGDDSYLQKCVLLTDAMSSVPGFEKEGEAFIKEMTARGMRTALCADYLS